MSTSVQSPTAKANPAQDSYMVQRALQLRTPNTSSNTTPITPVGPQSTPDDRVQRVRKQEATDDSQKKAQAQTQAIQQPVQVADQALASTVITGEYDAKALFRPPAPRIGGYIATRVF